MGGTVLENCDALDLVASDDGTVSGLQTTHGRMNAPAVIVATGPDTPETFAKITGYDGFTNAIPVTKVPGLLLTTPPLDQSMRPNRVIYAGTTKEFHILPAFNGGVKIGSDDVDGLISRDQSASNILRCGQILLDRAQACIPGLARHVDINDCKADIGIRAYQSDGKSVICQMPGANGLYIVATHSGITLAPALGSLMAEMLATGTAPPILAPFGIQRFSGFGDPA
jgi:glycine/D-amino acid oxidase-like deaminating enzyme